MRHPLVRRALSRRTLIPALILLVALAIRVAEVQRTSYQPINDAASYLTLASQVAQTGDYSTSHANIGAGGTIGPTAYFPPGFPYFLAAVDLIDGHTGVHRTSSGVAADPGAVKPARISQAVLGTVVVGLIGLVALEAFGAGVALVALALAAVYPVLVELSAVLVAENLMTAFILAAIWAALRAGRAGRAYGWIAACGVFTGLAGLTHVNALILLVPLLIAAWRTRPRGSSRSPLTAPALLIAVTVVTVLPWVVRDAVVTHRFIAVSDENGVTLVGTYNRASAHDPQVPYRWRLFFGIPGEQALIRQAPHLTEPALSSRLQTQAFNYIGVHPLSPFVVAYDNTRRMLELEGSAAWKISAASIGLPIATARIGVVSFWILCLLAVAGAFTPAARRAPRWLWLAAVLLWLTAALVNGETPRFREPVDPFLVLLSACALEAAVRWAWTRLGGAPVGGESGDALPAVAGEGVQMAQSLA